VSVHVVLDKTALTSYAVLKDWATPVAELLISVMENGGLVGVPALCVLDAFAELNFAERRHLTELLAGAEGVALILPLLSHDTVPIAARDVGVEPGFAHVLAEVRTQGALVATYDVELYANELDEDDVLDLSE
jgi:hypothetical protein